ncbi:MAG: tRNA (adenosine(37)-N6)-threonylcarbamoyltransferase complex ATPase subunit type 1 TsaE [Candidatus Wildermuthbacteria bacterium]|nr:tRNA (adenosine(37)-N6)-threonylcarbamoyltransferase complex ATPase subunit type 1 TsaE [Candidatus Wildermuthbacteria bacterium]
MKSFASFELSSPAATRKAGALLAKNIQTADSRSQALVIGLAGELGSGKTTFAQGFIKGCGVRERATSPTFLIFKKFQLPQAVSAPFSFLYHFDCYRIQRSQELVSLGWKEIVANPVNIVLVEWPELCLPLR